MTKLPAQNVIAIVAILYAGELGVEALTTGDWCNGAWRALPWVASVLAARAVAKWLLQRWKSWRFIGLAVILLASSFTAMAQLADKQVCTALGCSERIRFCSTFLLLAATAPWFIRKEQFSNLPSG